MNESTIEAYLVKRVREAGGIAYKFTSPGRRSVPDRLVLLPPRDIREADLCTYYGLGRVVFVELKATGKKPTVAQAREHARLRALGFRVEVLDSKARIDAFMRTV